MSIRVRFILVISLVSLIAAAGLAYMSYNFTLKASLAEARKKGDIVAKFLESSRAFYRAKQRPIVMEIVDKNRFYPNLMSGFAVTRGVWDEFSKNITDYRFKQATLDPLYPPNKADIQEKSLIAEFDVNKDMKVKEGVMEKNGEQYFYYARPIKVGAKCLRCHGDPADAPKDQIEMYGTENGYNWTAGKTVAAYLTYVPIQKAIDDARKSALILFGYGVAGIALLSLVIWFFFERYIVAPVTNLEKRATDISVGKNIDAKIEAGSNDEIGALARALERMRVSVVKLIERCGS